MTLRRRSFVLIALCSIPACAARAPRTGHTLVPAEALTDSNTIRLRCEDPAGVLAGRVLCVLKDLPRGGAARTP